MWLPAVALPFLRSFGGGGPEPIAINGQLYMDVSLTFQLSSSENVFRGFGWFGHLWFG